MFEDGGTPVAMENTLELPSLFEFPSSLFSWIAMRLILGITLFLIGSGMWACRLEGLAVDTPLDQGASTWVRTADGWESMETWYVEADPPLRLHPLTVAAGQCLLSLLALVAYSKQQW